MRAQLTDLGEPRDPHGAFRAAARELVLREAAESVLRYEHLKTVAPELWQAAEEIHSRTSGDASEDRLTEIVELLIANSDDTRVRDIIYDFKFIHPIYRLTNTTYWENVEAPPTSLKLGFRPDVSGRSWHLLGQKIGFPIGLPSSVLTPDAQWGKLWADNGFNIITTKTFREHESNGHAKEPHWLLIEPSDQVTPTFPSPPTSLTVESRMGVRPSDQEISSVNSIGIPSPPAAVWADQVSALDAALQEIDGTILIVSVVGDEMEFDRDVDELAASFARVALIAQQSGATNVELNLSNPNARADGASLPPICAVHDKARVVVERVRSALDPRTKLVVKLAYMQRDELRSLLEQIGPHIDAVSGINAVKVDSVTIADASGSLRQLFPGRPEAGLAGTDIHGLAIDFVQSCRDLRVQLGYRFEILASGGVTDPDSFKALYDAGADAVLSCTGAEANWLLAFDCHQAFGNDLADRPSENSAVVRRCVEEFVWDRLRTPKSTVALASLMLDSPARPSTTVGVLKDLEREGRLTLEYLRGDVVVQPA